MIFTFHIITTYYKDEEKGVRFMKINYFYAWTKNKDKRNEYTKSLGGGFRLPSFLKWLNIFSKNRK